LDVTRSFEKRQKLELALKCYHELVAKNPVSPQAKMAGDRVKALSKNAQRDR
jgi:hypothetical protein